MCVCVCTSIQGVGQPSSREKRRNKTEGGKAVMVSQGRATKESERESSPPLPVGKSKHQLKKAKKQVPYNFPVRALVDR